jgi:hypothetical protein
MLNLFGRKAAPAPKASVEATAFWRAFTTDGLALARREADLPAGALDPRHVDHPALDGALAQAEDDGLVLDAGVVRVLPWQSVFELLDDAGYRGIRELLALPEDAGRVPVLQSINTLTDQKFTIALTGWRREGEAKTAVLEECGAILHDGTSLWLMSRSAWALAAQIAAFQGRSSAERDPSSNRRHWGRIRRDALGANAAMNGFLTKTVVLTPEKLRIDLRPSASDGSRVVEVIPGFEDQPEGWLRAFDTHAVSDLYNITTPDGGIVQVVVPPNVKTVLENIKRMPGRRVAGSRAEAFLVNPYAALGDAASETIDETQFMEARAKAGLLFERFFAHVGRDDHGYPVLVALNIEAPKSETEIEKEVRPFADDVELAEFIEKVEASLAGGFQLCGWKGYDFELFGETRTELDALKSALDERAEPQILVSYSSIYDLSSYSSRIEAIGEEKPFYSPFIAKKDDGEGWFPENIEMGIAWTPEGQSETVAVPLTPKTRLQIEQKIAEATERGDETVELPGFPKPIPVGEAQSILGILTAVSKDVRTRSFDPTKPSDEAAAKAAKHLVMKANIQNVDYEESRREILSGRDEKPVLPTALKPDAELKDHQKVGVAWLQHLFGKAPTHCRGAVLADDMGLGKTLQILTFLAWAFESDPSLPPALVVAPVSLLENWEEEARKFLRDGTLSLLTAYGDAISGLRVPRESIDAQLRADGLVKFLRPGWRGAANVVLTTYETLRDLEFSFAAENWSVMVCDEAQRIKNPNAMVTRAAKKQNVTFKIACTGTPVENTLTDLWCLFDYVQPGLLGALNDFGRRYRRPIEAETEEEKARVEELRARIAPQILRRTKAEVAKDLPKRHDPPVLISLSNDQRRLYAQAIELFKKRNDSDSSSAFKNHLGLLHYLRLICTDPRPVGQSVFRPEPLGQYRERSPKLDWLLGKLHDIKAIGNGGEKAIVFCEFKEIQRLLRHYILEEFGIAPDIINGDTAASAKNADSRHKRIKAFQSKPGFGVIILSPVAVGFGVNIQKANHVIHYTRHWNPAKEDQATDRAHRIGQEKEVTVYCPIVKAEDFTTFDVKLDKLLRMKRGLAQDMLNGSGDVLPGDFSLDDMVPGVEAPGGLSPPLTLDDICDMDWEQFEFFVAALWLKKGFRTAYKTPRHDGGVDVVAFAGDRGALIQCKTSGTDGRHLGWEAVKDVVAGEARYRMSHPGVLFQKVCVTNQYFNDSAREQARLNGVEIVDRDDIEGLLGRHPLSALDVERLKFDAWDPAVA